MAKAGAGTAIVKEAVVQKGRAQRGCGCVPSIPTLHIHFLRGAHRWAPFLLWQHEHLPPIA